jgi:hypothetical protein
MAFLQQHSEIVEELTMVASDVYDDNMSNVASGFNYLKQETNRTHIQDIAIRKVISKLGKTFRGNQLIQIRQEVGNHPLSVTLSPGRVPFHQQRRIRLPWLTGWWKPGSVECWYQSNKILQIR